MVKAIGLYFLLVCFWGCKEDCEPAKNYILNQNFKTWMGNSLVNGKSYKRFKSNKGLEESFMIDSKMENSYVYKSKHEGCYNDKGEVIRFEIKSTIYKKHIEIILTQEGPDENIIWMVSRSTGEFAIDEGGLVFKNNIAYKTILTISDSSLQFFNNYDVNNNLYENVIKMYCTYGAKNIGSENIKEILIAKGYGIIQYTCSDNTQWNLVE